MTTATSDRVPSVENRLNNIRKTLGLVSILGAALARTDDLCLPHDVLQEGYGLLGELAEQAYHDAAAVEQVCDAEHNRLIFLPAPDAKGDA
jgi:hypothetical protein